MSATDTLDVVELLTDDIEKEEHAAWIARTLSNSMTGRYFMSGYETLRTTGTTVICLSPWGDSSPLILPCIRYRDLAMHAAMALTGGTAALIEPMMTPMQDMVVQQVGDSLADIIAVELATFAAFEAVSYAGDSAIDWAVDASIPIHAGLARSTSVKTMTITVRHKLVNKDAVLSFFRSSLHEEKSKTSLSGLKSAGKEYLGIKKGWFSPYLYASARRPAIPRATTPDIICCFGPYLKGDYKVGETLLTHSASPILLCSEPPAYDDDDDERDSDKPSPMTTSRRFVITVVGLNPHRLDAWTTCARPGESVMKYQLLNGCPTVVVPVKLEQGAPQPPLVAWLAATLEQLWKIELPRDMECKDVDVEAPITDGLGSVRSIVAVLYQFLDLCVDWERVAVPNKKGSLTGDEDARHALKVALTLLVVGAIVSGKSKEVKKDIDKKRSGIAMWRIL